MPGYVITYDVRSSNHDYSKLYAMLNSWKAAHLQNSVWLAELVGPAVTIRELIKSTLHKDDTVAVIQIFGNSDWAVLNARQTGVDWLNAKIG